MAKHKLTPDAAFGFLVRTSTHSNIKVRDIAVRMIKSHVAEVSDLTPPS